MSCDAIVFLGLQAIGGRCGVLCQYMVVVQVVVSCQETYHCKTQLPINAIIKPWILSWRCLLPKCHHSYFCSFRVSVQFVSCLWRDPLVSFPLPSLIGLFALVTLGLFQLSIEPLISPSFISVNLFRKS